MDFKFDDSGFKNIKNKIKMKVRINDLFNPMFMKRFTKSSSFEEFILKSGLVNSEKEVTLEACEAIPDKDLDKYIRKNTKFPSWEAMHSKAVMEYLKSQYKSKGMQLFKE